MSYSAPMETETASPTVYPGRRRNFVAAIGMLVAGISIFWMGLTEVFFVRAVAWVFILWGVLLFYSNLLDITLTCEVSDATLILRSPLRFWGMVRTWSLQRIAGMDVVVGRIEATEEDVKIQIYYTPEDSMAIEQEDLPYYPGLAALIVEKAGLKPGRDQEMQSFDRIPQGGKATYTWRK